MNKVTFDDYWLGYLAGHARPLTRVLHYFGLFFGQLLGLFASSACGLKPDQPSPSGAITRVVSPIRLYS